MCLEVLLRESERNILPLLLELAPPRRETDAQANAPPRVPWAHVSHFIDLARAERVRLIRSETGRPVRSAQHERGFATSPLRLQNTRRLGAAEEHTASQPQEQRLCVTRHLVC